MAKYTFETLPTQQFALRMRPHAKAVYERLIPGVKVQWLDAQNKPHHAWLDKEFGVDLFLHLPCDTIVTVQEKYREPGRYARFGDFTVEWRNAVGTPYESNGEWFKLAAQWYFYAWANADETGWERWVLMDIGRLKMLVNGGGGLSKVGRIWSNQEHGAATFYSIPWSFLRLAIMMSSERLRVLEKRRLTTMSQPA